MFFFTLIEIAGEEKGIQVIFYTALHTLHCYNCVIVIRKGILGKLHCYNCDIVGREGIIGIIHYYNCDIIEGKVI